VLSQLNAVRPQLFEAFFIANPHPPPIVTLNEDQGAIEGKPGNISSPGTVPDFLREIDHVSRLSFRSISIPIMALSFLGEHTVVRGKLVILAAR
jgi:hypothetical protein